MTEEETADGGDGGLGRREDHRAEEEEVEMRKEGWREEDEEKDLEEYLEEEEEALPREEEVLESRAQTAASICLKSPFRRAEE